MARVVGVLAAVAVLATAGGATGPATGSGADLSAAAAPAAGHNVVVILTDDMRTDDLAYMPAVRRLIEGRGVRFTHAYAVNPICCPSRVSILTGQYGHNSGVEDNFFPNGGFASFDDDRTVATWLDRSGYTTGYLGKYLNQYGKTARRYVPPGWDVWKAAVRGVYAYRGRTRYNINGALRTLRGYQADTLTDLATAFVRAHADEPMFLHVAYSTPHGATERDALGTPPVPAVRHRHAYDGVSADVDSPAYNEADMSDKPPVVRQRRMTDRELEHTQVVTEARRESLLAVDEGVARIVGALRNRGLLDETTIVFSSDNGYFVGEHRFPAGKRLAYDPVSRVPLLIRGPGIPPGITRPHVVGLHDLAPTFLRLAGAWGAQRGFPIDGRNLLPLVNDPGGDETGRDLLIESLDPRSRWDFYDAIRTTSGYKYVEYAHQAGVELYDLASDPSEVDNLAGKPAYADLQRRLADRLDAVRNCAGAECR